MLPAQMQASTFLLSAAIHTVLLETDVRRSDFVVIFFQLTQNWTALNFEVNFRPLIQWDSRGLFCKSIMKLSNLLSECEIRTSEDVRASKRSKSDFMYCRKFTLRPARNLKKEFCVVPPCSVAIKPHKFVLHLFA